jgi:hypothetical protein
MWYALSLKTLLESLILPHLSLLILWGQFHSMACLQESTALVFGFKVFSSARRGHPREYMLRDSSIFISDSFFSIICSWLLQTLLTLWFARSTRLLVSDPIKACTTWWSIWRFFTIDRKHLYSPAESLSGKRSSWLWSVGYRIREFWRARVMSDFSEWAVTNTFWKLCLEHSCIWSRSQRYHWIHMKRLKGTFTMAWLTLAALLS